jgi:hypothetical protein
MEAHWRRLLNIAEAERSEWQRTVVENQEFAAGIQQLRQSLGLPVANHMAFIRWLENTDGEIQEQLHKAIEELMDKHHARKEWFGAIWNRVIGGDKFFMGPSFSLGFPKGKSWYEDGRVIYQPVIDETVDRKNPIVQNYIDLMLDGTRSTPPKPQPSKNNPRKLDWIPVWEWWKRHPDVEVNELARMLGYARSYLSRKLNEVEAERSSNKSE